MSQKETLNRIFYYLTGALAENVTATWTNGTGTLAGMYFAIGWDAIDNQPDKIPFKYPISCIIDLPEGSGYNKVMETQGYPSGTFIEDYTFSFWVVRKLSGNRNSLFGTSTEKGIMELTEDLLFLLTGTEDAMKLVISGSSYTDSVVYPIAIEEGSGVDSSGALYARARRFDLTYRRLELDY